MIPRPCTVARAIARRVILKYRWEEEQEKVMEVKEK